ncbi:MAG: DEAD/DEAH box helicase, partial [Actinomycetota bacterium]|nr:DEAD/DEAH box helicase [Actinomycetota bacterium]
MSVDTAALLAPASTRPARDPVGGFAAMNVPPRLVETLARQGITVPTPVQAAVVPDALAGRDVLGRARTGSGKT